MHDAPMALLAVFASQFLLPAALSVSGRRPQEPEPIDGRVYETQEEFGRADLAPARWTPKKRDLCDPQLAMDVSGRARGFNSKRMAIVFWKGVFRSSRIHNVEVGYKSCSTGAAVAQLAVSRNQVKHIVEPLEGAGFKLDILIYAQSCSNSTLHQDLVNIYDGGHNRVVKTKFHEPTLNQYTTITKGAEFVLEHLRRGAEYESILFWRFDLMSLKPFNIIETREELSAEPLIQDLPLSESGISPSYRDSVRNFMVVAIEDNVVSVPGWVAPCVLYPIAIDDPSTKPQWQNSGEWRGSLLMNSDGDISRDNNFTFDCIFPHEEMAVYRGPLGYGFYSIDPLATCITLHDSFGGGSCSVNELARVHCADECASEPSEGPACFQRFWGEVDKAKARWRGGGPSLDPGAGAREWSREPPRLTACP